MVYVKNVPNGERVLRILLGAGAAGAGVLMVGGMAGWLIAASAGGLVLSGLLGFCPACAMVGRKLRQP
ncbi:YgaP-like transmembrane domain [Roseateles sp. BYS78W]|uniref:YgaP-like transmembrane domain n=1 Tax=Pelomonas candidula TaxID=3299025 RepID=A0ABW7HHI6_9BURK